MTDPLKTHFTTRRGFIAAAGFAGVSLYGLWAAYGAAPGPMALLGLDHSEAAPHAAGHAAEPEMARTRAADAHAGHGTGVAAASDTQAFSRRSAEFIERFRLPDGRVYPRHGTAIGANDADPHAGHAMHGGTTAGATAAPASGQVAAGQAMASAQDDPIDVLMTAGKWFYLPAALRLDAGQRYRFRMMALDVGHGASVQFGRGGRMMRLPPGRVAETELRFVRPGRYLMHCTVYCGLAHDVMQASIEVV